MRTILRIVDYRTDLQGKGCLFKRQPRYTFSNEFENQGWGIVSPDTCSSTTVLEIKPILM